MKTLQRKLYRLYRGRYFPFLIFLFFILILHMFVSLNFSDDLKFKAILQHENLFTWLRERYFNWSSRTLIEAVMVSVLRIGKLWRVLDVLMMLTLVFSLSRLFVHRRARTMNGLIVALFFLIPAGTMYSAGWGATTINYLWPAALGLVSLFPVKKILDEQKITVPEYIFHSIALIYAVNQEQLCVTLLVAYGCLFAFYCCKRRFSFFLLLQFLITAAGFLYIYRSPGNHVRLMVQIEKYHHDFFMIPMASKIEIGAFSSTLNHFIFQFDPIFLLLCLLLAVGVCTKYKDMMLRAVGILPLFVTLVFGVFGSSITARLFPEAALLLRRTDVMPYGYIRLDNVWTFGSYMPMAVLSLVCVCILLALLYIVENRRTLFIIYLTLFSGFMSRMVIGFTPSAWGSGVRAFLFLYVALIITILLVYQEISPLKSRRFNQWFLLMTFMISGLAALNGYAVAV